jgi:Leucine-rich repeat (LRR) protein
MNISSNKTKNKKNSPKRNEFKPTNNNNNTDENQNNQNTIKHINKTQNINSNNNDNDSLKNNINNIHEISKEKLQNLHYIFPFLKEGINNNSEITHKSNNYSVSEYNKIVSSINKNKSLINNNNKNNKNEEEMLEGKLNIIDKVIQRHVPASADSKIIKIHQNLTSLTLNIDKNFNMMNDVGYRLPNLIELDLSGSDIESIMDIGTSFTKLEKLNVSNCGLNDLSGLICFKNLKQLNASNNNISDLIDIEMCDELKMIDLSNNLITDESNLLFFNSCQKLQKVILTGNKIKNYNRDLINKNIQIVI